MSVESVMKEIEQKTAAKVVEYTAAGKIADPLKKQMTKEEAKKSADVLQNIMAAGAEEFKQKTGRNMTYAEMRAMYG